MTENQLISLIARYLSEELSEDEIRKLKQWTDAHPDNQLLLNRIANEEELEKQLNLWRNINAEKGYVRWASYRQSRRSARIRRLAG